MLEYIGEVNVSNYDIEKLARILAAVAYDYGDTVEEMATRIVREAQQYHASYKHNEQGATIRSRVVINEVVPDWNGGKRYFIETWDRASKEWKRLGLYHGDDPIEWFNKSTYKYITLDGVVDEDRVLFFSDDGGGWRAPRFFRARLVEDEGNE